MFDTVRGGDQLAGIIAGLDPDAVSAQSAQSCGTPWTASNAWPAAARPCWPGGWPPPTRRPAPATAPPRCWPATAEPHSARPKTPWTPTRLPDLDKVAAAIRRGELSPAQATLITEAAAADPTAQDQLLAMAFRGSIPDLREECARVKTAADPDPAATNQRIHQRRYLRRYTDREGGWNLHARGTAEQGAAFNTALSRSSTRSSTPPAGKAGRSGRRPTPSTPRWPWPTGPPAPLGPIPPGPARPPAPPGGDDRADTAGDTNPESAAGGSGAAAEESGPSRGDHRLLR